MVEARSEAVSADVAPESAGDAAAATNLPAQLTSFLGRQVELDAAAAALRGHRLVTLTGPGGSGKTRLASQVAANPAGRFPDGIWWVDLAPLADAPLVPAALAGVLGVGEAAAKSAEDAITRYLRARRVLLVLDNCEHLIAACALLAARLVAACPGVTVLATSRELLGVPGEAVLRVPPLSLPADDSPAAVIDAEAVRLFVDRAVTLSPAFAVTEANASTVADICRRLDGMPLAIELAAARTRLLTVEEIAEGLADRFRLLTGGSRWALPRHRTLEGSVAWSHDLLDNGERRVFRRLAVFAGSFTFAAARAVCAADDLDPDEVLDRLSGLVDRSLVQVVDTAGARSRYRLLETIREFALAKLIEAEEEVVGRDRHLDFYASFAAEAAAGLTGPDLLAWLAQIDAELDNLRAALDWSPRSAHADRGVLLVGRLLVYWFSRSDLGVGHGRLETAAKAASGDSVERAHALLALSWIAYRAGDMVVARRFVDEAVELARRAADTPMLGGALSHRGLVRFWGEADSAGGWADFDEAAAILRRTDDRLFRALNLGWLGQSYMDTTNSRRARTAFTEGLELTDGGPMYGRAPCLVGFGMLEVFEARFASAAAILDEALSLVQATNDHYSAILARTFLTILNVYRGEYGAARGFCDPGFATAVEHGTPNGVGFMQFASGHLAFAEGRLEAAGSVLESAIELLEPLIPSVAAHARGLLANVALAQADTDLAAKCANAALSVGRAADSVGAIEWALLAQAWLALSEGDTHRAEDLLHERLSRATQIEHWIWVPDTLEGLAGVTANDGRTDLAARLLGAAQMARDSVGAVRWRVFQPRYDADHDFIRTALGADTFETLWAEGAALSLTDAVTYATRGRGQRKRPSHGWDSLTPAEQQVVDFVAAGLTNPQIGERLFISRRTVQAHLSHVFSKLGVSARAELAAHAARRDVAGT